MASLRQLLVLALPATFAACGGGDGDSFDPPSGPHYGYVANQVTVPANNSQAREIGLDLNGDKTVDNQLGMVLGTLAGQGFKVQDTLDEAVDTGSIIFLIDLQTPDLASTTGAGLNVRLGDNPNPAPCTNPDDVTTCGKHLAGGAEFTLDPNSPTDAFVGGKIAGGVFSGGPGSLTLQIALADAAPIELNLIGARAKISGISATGLTSVILAGALTQEDLDTKVIPTIQAQLPPLIARDCDTDADGIIDADDPSVGTPVTANSCGCPSGTTGKTIIGLFDTTPKDCGVTVEEIKTNSLIQSLLAPDVTIDGQDALSIGIEVSTVNAKFPGIDGN